MDKDKTPRMGKQTAVRLPLSESLDLLFREGFRNPFHMHWDGWLLERWERLDGGYRLVAYKGGGLYLLEDVNDPQWKEIMDVVYGEDVRPSLFTSEDWFQLEIEYFGVGSGTLTQMLSCSEVPLTEADWRTFVEKYKGIVNQLGECTFSLKNAHTGEILFSNTYRQDQRGATKIVTGKKKRSEG